MRIESKIGKIPHSEQKIYHFVADFNNFKNLVPSDQVINWESTSEECSFEVHELGKIGMKIIEKEPFKLVKISSTNTSPIKFNLWVQLKKSDENITMVKITVEPEVNIMMSALVKDPLKKFVDQLVDQMISFNF